MKDIFGRRNEPADPLQLDDRFHDADKQQSIACSQHFARRNGRNRAADAIDFRQKETGKMAETSRFDRLSNEWAVGLDLHLHGVFLRVVICRKSRASVGKQVPRGKNDIGAADERSRHADSTDVKHPQLVIDAQLFDDHALHDQIRARANQRHGAAEDRGVAEWDHQL